jgi:type IV fimbrial biogenesis protein FimT
MNPTLSRQPPCASGLSLIELLLVLAISAILLGASLPALGEFVRTYRLRLAAADFLGAVELARNEAIAHGGKVMLAPTSDSLDWADGWTVFVDHNGNRRPDAGDEVLMRHPPIHTGIAVDMAFGGQQGPPYLAYNSAGRGCAHGNSLAPRFGTVSLRLGERVRRIKINMLGRARMCDPAVKGSQCEGPDD